MPTTTEYPLNLWTRVVSDTSGTPDPKMLFLNHADRATISAGTDFRDSSSSSWSVFTRGSGVIQSAAAGKFGSSGLLLSGSTALADAARISWNMILPTSAGDRLPMVIDTFVNFSGLDPNGMVWAEISPQVQVDYAQFSVSQNVGTSGGAAWKLHASFFSNALGLWMNKDWVCPTAITTGTFFHFAMVRVQSIALVAAFTYGWYAFQNGVACQAEVGGTPTTSAGSYFVPAVFEISSGPYLSWGGKVVVAGAVTNPFVSLPGYMDEMRVMWNTTDGAVTDGTAPGGVRFTVPTAAYAPADGTFNTSFKAISMDSTTYYPVSDGLMNLGKASYRWKDLWSMGTTYLATVGTDYLMVGTYGIQFGSSNTYIFSSASGNMTLTAGTQINFGAHVGIAAKNFIFDTVTGVTFATTTNQKLAFYGSTPIVQPTGNIVLGLTSLGLISNPFLPGSTATISTASTTYSLVSGDQYLICESGTAFAVTLPAAIGSAKEYMIKNIGSGAVTVTANTADLIDSAATTTLGQWAFVKVVDYLPKSVGLDTSVRFLCHCNGTTNQTTFVDESSYAHTITAFGTARIATDIYKFGVSASSFGGADADRLTVGSATAFYIGASSFTMDLWYYPLTLSGTTAVFSQWGGGGANGQFYWASVGTTMAFYYSTDGASETSMGTGITLATGTWQHIAAVRDGTVMKFYHQGIQKGTGPGNFTFNNSTLPLNLSTYGNGSGQAINGYVDEVRFAIGKAWFTTGFTPATFQYGSRAGLWLSIT